MRNKLTFFILTALFFIPSWNQAREKYNFNSNWCLQIGDIKGAEQASYPDKNWKSITLPHAFNENEAFRLSIEQLTDTVVWYRKHFRLPKESKGKKIFIEFEGIRHGGDFYVNGKYVGLHENGVMAVGWDITPYIKYDKENVIAVRIDNSWDYRERHSNTKYQWNNRNFNANYGGIPKNVWLHITDKLYQTLPLYNNLKTTGVYIYADAIRVKERKAVIHAESQLKNEFSKTIEVGYQVDIYDRENRLVKTFKGETLRIAPGQTKTIKAQSEVGNLHFWSWGYGYLYTVQTSLTVNGKATDTVHTRTGFRKTRFADGKIWLNERVLQMKGFAQRTSNEWPGVGMSVPAWLSDFSNGMIVEGCGNLIRWMHVTPWKQDVESCDRVGLIQAMPAGDAEKDCKGRQWEQRVELMRDAIIYNRNNPSILFYECGNESISREHMIEMIAVRDEFDPHGGRAIGSREMLDIREAEYGGEMLYINKSAHHPMWAMEYCRDEGLRKYWDAYSYPYHPEGKGPLYRNKEAGDYNHNQDILAIANIKCWYDYWRERPGTGKRVSSGGAKIIFSDTNTHYRGEENYRRSGVTDAMRIPKDAFYANQVMWDGWVDPENPHTYLIGHWNYEPSVVKPVYVVSNADKVQLFLNGHSLGWGKQDYRFLYTFENIAYQAGTLEAVGYDKSGNECSRARLETAGKPEALRLKLIQSPQGFKADGADMVLVEVEVIDNKGRRCPLANDAVQFKLDGPAEWRGGIAQGPENYILSSTLPVECGVNRALIRSTTQAGNIHLTASAKGLKSAELSFSSAPVEVRNGLSTYLPGEELQGCLLRGKTPSTPSFRDTKIDVPILSARAGINQEDLSNSFDDNELSEWHNNGKLETAWITYRFERKATVNEICMKLSDWRNRSYPLEIYAGDTLIWSGDTEKSLGYIHLYVKPVQTHEITIRLKGASKEGDAFGQIVELAAENKPNKKQNNSKAQHRLRIVEIEFKEWIQ